MNIIPTIFNITIAAIGVVFIVIAYNLPVCDVSLSSPSHMVQKPSTTIQGVLGVKNQELQVRHQVRDVPSNKPGVFHHEQLVHQAQQQAKTQQAPGGQQQQAPHTAPPHIQASFREWIDPKVDLFCPSNVCLVIGTSLLVASGFNLLAENEHSNCIVERGLFSTENGFLVILLVMTGLAFASASKLEKNNAGGFGPAYSKVVKKAGGALLIVTTVLAGTRMVRSDKLF
jgi:hypothetical protein